MKLGVLLVRADASLAIGTGHVMRCLALAQAWADAGGNAVFAMADATPAVEERLRNEGFEVARLAARVGSAAEAEETAQLAHQHGASWVVVDGYEFGAEYQADLKSRGLKVLFIDDNGHAAHYSADLVLNQNAHAREEMYGKRATGTRLLLGSRYTLLRNEFTVYRDWERNVPERGTRVLLTMGGSDPKDLTPGILSAIADLSIDGLQIRVVVGGSTENRSGVAEEAEKYPGRVEVMSNVANMAELMAWADLAIAGAGTTCWEMCLLGVPAILVVVAENQKFIARQLAQMGAAVNAGPAELIDCSALAQVTAELLENRDRRLNMSQSARQLVDGKGSERVLEMMQLGELSCA